MTTTLRTLRLEYSLPDDKLRGNSRAHWTVKHRAAKAMRLDAHMLGMFDGLGHTYAKARITYHFYHNRKIDLDNLAIGMKPFVDGLVDSKVIPDDTPEHVTFGEHTFNKQTFSKGTFSIGKSWVDIVVEEIADE